MHRTVRFGTLVLLCTWFCAAPTVAAAQREAAPITTGFKCTRIMTPVSGFYVDTPYGYLNARQKIDLRCGPPVQLT